jgi:sugar lactone lactonase YvrE
MTKMKLFLRLLIFFLVLWGQPALGKGLEVVARLSQAPGNIAVTPDRRLIVSQHALYFPRYSVVEVLSDGTTKPFPNEQWATAPGKDGVGLTSVLGIRSDQQGIIWMLDNGKDFSRLVAWDSRRNTLHKIIKVAEPARKYNSFFNDLALDPVHNKIYISDVASPENSAIVIVDTKTGKSRRVLEGHKTVVAEPLPVVIGDKTMSVDENGKGKPTIGVDPITIDTKSEWVYYGASQSTSLWRIRTADLANETLSDAQLASRIERYGDRPICDGITIDGAGNIYITDITNYAVGVLEPSGKYRILHSDKKLLVWPDGMSYGPDGYIYVAVSQLHLSIVFNEGKNLSKLPFYLLRFKALAKGTVGR